MAGGYSLICRVRLLRVNIPAGKALKKNKHRWGKGLVRPPLTGVQQLLLDSVLPKKANEKIYIQTRLGLVVRRSR